jgi:hypothetical protein
MAGYRDPIHYWVTTINPGGYWGHDCQLRGMRNGVHQT